MRQTQKIIYSAVVLLFLSASFSPIQRQSVHILSPFNSFSFLVCFSCRVNKPKNVVFYDYDAVIRTTTAGGWPSAAAAV
jgi:hypothetical protein